MTPDLSQTSERPHDVAGALRDIRAAIAAAALGAGRNPAAVTLVAVSKFHPAAAVSAAMAAGQMIFGENRVQEAAGKFGPLRAAATPFALHIIGALQTNKALAAVQLADCIESLDRLRLADAIAKAADAAGRMPDLLVQINIGDEPQKAGVPTAEADAFIRDMRARFGAALRGLMCIPPAGQPPLPFFHHLVELADTHGLPIRSMGMSEDFEAAISAGATHIRIGSALFGHRETNF